MGTITVDRGRTKTVRVSFGRDISDSVFTSQIRAGNKDSSVLIATWAVAFETDGTDGELLMTLDNAVTSAITYKIGYTDLKNVVDGEPESVWPAPLQVIFRDVITA